MKKQKHWADNWVRKSPRSYKAFCYAACCVIAFICLLVILPINFFQEVGRAISNFSWWYVAEPYRVTKASFKAVSRNVDTWFDDIKDDL